MVQEAYPGSDMEGGRAIRNGRMPQVKSLKDPNIEDDAILKIMQLAIYGSMLKPKEGVEVRDSLEDVLKLFKDVGLIK